jgi:multiple sugar transport system ATP-binding protein
MVFQSYALYPHMSVERNMAFGLEESTEMPDDEIAETVQSAAGMLGIGDLLDRKPGDLSGGQQQRVALGRAIVRDPDVFLMDEPLSNLDAKLRAQMRTELQELQADLGVSTVYVTHDQTEAMTMGDRIAILDDGELQQVGTPLECYHEPNNRFVAGFIGEPSMNFFETTREGDRLVHDAFAYPLPDDAAASVREGESVTLGIRPEDVAIGDVAGDHAFPAEVTVVEPMGNENNVHLRFTAAAHDADDFVAVVDGTETHRHGEGLDAYVPPEKIHLFGPDGTAIKNREPIDAGRDAERAEQEPNGA